MQGKTAKPFGLIAIVVVVLGAICLFSVFGGLRNLLGGAGQVLGGGSPGGVPSGGVPGSSQSGQLGQLVATTNVDNNGCPSQAASEFYSDETVFVGMDESVIPRGTEMFMRLYYEGQPVEDTDPIRASQDMQSCVWFQFDPTGRAGMEPGNYEAELIVNGNTADTVQFQVADAVSGAGTIPNTGSSSGGYAEPQFGQAFTATAVDASGCPVDNVYEFYSNESVYVGFDQSYIPAGTEMFARLYENGQAVEDTQPIVADQDLESCVWFEFQAGQFDGGFSPGEYEVEMYANGSLVERLPFTVR